MKNIPRGRILVVFDALLLFVLAITTAGAFNPDTLVSVGIPPGPFSQNKQNEPALT